MREARISGETCTVQYFFYFMDKVRDEISYPGNEEKEYDDGRQHEQPVTGSTRSSEYISVQDKEHDKKYSGERSFWCVHGI
jgi:hypothetical protein